MGLRGRVGGAVLRAPRTVFSSILRQERVARQTRSSSHPFIRIPAPEPNGRAFAPDPCSIPRLLERIHCLSGRLALGQSLHGLSGGEHRGREQRGRELPGRLGIARLVWNLDRAIAGPGWSTCSESDFELNPIPFLQSPKPRVPGQAGDFWGPSRANFPRPV